MDEMDRRRYNDNERDYYTNNDRRDREPRPQQSYRPSSYNEPPRYRSDYRDDYRDYRPEPQRPPADDYRQYAPMPEMRYTQTDEKKKKGFFQFGKKDDASNVRNVIIAYPKSYDDVSGIIDSLRARQAIIVDFRRVSGKDTQRVLDFLSGAIYALGGSQQHINDNMFLFTPEGVSIQGPSSLKRKYD